MPNCSRSPIQPFGVTSKRLFSTATSRPRACIRCVIATLRDRTEGILRAHAEIRPFFASGLRQLPNVLGRWYRTGLFFSNGRQLIWEYPRVTPDGDQVDLVEITEITHGRITHHRAYWGWVGFKALTATR